MRNILIPLVFCLSVWVEACYAKHVWEGVERIVAVGDVHGAYASLVSVLQAAQIIDDDLAWSGGHTHLVSLGDLLDRGPQSRKVMDLLMRLQDEARAGGGQVHVLLGNHELMNLTGDKRDVSLAEHAALADLGGHQAAFADEGHYGRWLLTLPFMIRINDTLFTHGGLPPFSPGMSLQQINATAARDLRTLLREGRRLRNMGVLEADEDLMLATYQADEQHLEQLGKAFVQAAGSSLLGPKGPLWYRGTAVCHELLEQELLSKSLNALHAQRVVVGHTPTPDREINTRFGDRVYLIDTGMLVKVYKGRPRVLEINQSMIRALDDQGEIVPINRSLLPEPDTVLSTAPYKIVKTDQSHTLLQFSGGVTAVFRKLSNRASKKALAAYRLDRFLGLHMVPATVLRNVEDREGILFSWTDQPLSERVRQTSNIGRPNYCAFDSDYALLAAFDALIGKTDRSADNLFYRRKGLNIIITQNFNAFGTGIRLPRTQTQHSLPAGFAQALSRLNMENLTALLEDLLSPRELRAILKRRDTILLWPVSNAQT